MYIKSCMDKTTIAYLVAPDNGLQFMAAVANRARDAAFKAEE